MLCALFYLRLKVQLLSSRSFKASFVKTYALNHSFTLYVIHFSLALLSLLHAKYNVSFNKLLFFCIYTVHHTHSTYKFSIIVFFFRFEELDIAYDYGIVDFYSAIYHHYVILRLITML
jgi:hypothetical protein